MSGEGKKFSSVENFTIGATSALVYVMASAPLERIKLMLQSQNEMLKADWLQKPYKGIVDCAIRIYRTEGILPFWIWRGNFARCLHYFPNQALNFALKDKFRLLFNIRKTDSRGVKLTKNILSGGVAGVLSHCSVYSLVYAQTRLANDVKVGEGASSHQFNGLIDVYRKTLKRDGPTGLYRGFATACIGITVYRGCYFGFYDTLRPILLGENAGMLSLVALGYVITISAGLIAYPLDTVCRRMMMTSGQATRYRGAWDCASQILKNEGHMSFMKGVGARILSGMVGADLLAGCDKVKQLYIHWRPS